jgi:hypothetical protein
LQTSWTTQNTTCPDPERNRYDSAATMRFIRDLEDAQVVQLSRAAGTR